MAITANRTVVLGAPKKEEKKQPIKAEEPVIETKSHEKKGLLAHKPSQFLHDMLNEQNKQE